MKYLKYDFKSDTFSENVKLADIYISTWIWIHKYWENIYYRELCLKNVQNKTKNKEENRYLFILCNDCGGNLLLLVYIGPC